MITMVRSSRAHPRPHEPTTPILSDQRTTLRPRQCLSHTTATTRTGRNSKSVMDGLATPSIASGHDVLHQATPHTAPIPHRELPVYNDGPVSGPGEGGRIGKVPFHTGANVCHQTRSALIARVSLTRWRGCSTEYAAPRSLLMKPRPGATQRHA